MLDVQRGEQGWRLPSWRPSHGGFDECDGFRGPSLTGCLIGQGREDVRAQGPVIGTVRRAQGGALRERGAWRSQFPTPPSRMIQYVAGTVPHQRDHRAEPPGG
jgi:hypothetical protein